MKTTFLSPFRSYQPLAASIILALMSAILAGGVTLPINPSVAATKPAVTKPAVVKPATTPTKPSTATNATPVTETYTQVSPLDLLKNPQTYLNQHVELVGIFNRFSDTGLDYKKAFRDSRDYVSLFILRPNIEPHIIPLSELKLFFPRKKSDEVTNLEGGDTVRIRGKVFSTALDEPWIDITDIKILQKTKESTKKPNEEL